MHQTDLNCICDFFNLILSKSIKMLQMQEPVASLLKPILYTTGRLLGLIMTISAEPDPQLMSHFNAHSDCHLQLEIIFHLCALSIRVFPRYKTILF